MTLRWCYDRGTLASDDGRLVTRLSPRQADVFQVLANTSSGQYVDNDTLITRVYGVVEPTTSRRCVWIYISQIRQRLRRGVNGVALASRKGLGYRLELLEPLEFTTFRTPVASGTSAYAAA